MKFSVLVLKLLLTFILGVCLGTGTRQVAKGQPDTDTKPDEHNGQLVAGNGPADSNVAPSKRALAEEMARACEGFDEMAESHRKVMRSIADRLKTIADAE